MPKINEIILKLEGFQYDRSLDLNILHYHIQLTEDVSNLHTTIIPWGKYRYKLLPMGVSKSTDILKQKIKHLFHGFEFIHASIDELLILTKSDRTDHVQKLEPTLTN